MYSGPEWGPYQGPIGKPLEFAGAMMPATGQFSLCYGAGPDVNEAPELAVEDFPMRL